MVKFIYILAVVLYGAAMSAGQSHDNGGDGIAQIYLAKDDGSGSAGAAAEGFLPTDVPIHCVVQLGEARAVTVRMNLVAVEVPGVKPETGVVSTSFTTNNEQSRVNFTGRPDRRWVAGRYRVDIFIGEKLAASRGFTVQKTPAPRPSADGVVQPKGGTKPKLPARRTGGT